MIVALILCGGSGSRIGGRNKPLIDVCGATLIERVIERLAPQVDEIIISANQELPRYQALGYRVVSDTPGQIAGPLAGVLAGIRLLKASGLAGTTRVQLAPGDTPFLPSNLVERLGSQQATVPFDGERAHHLHSQVTLSDALSAVENAPSETAVHRWLARQSARQIDFAESASAFLNINSDEQLAAARHRLEG